MDPSRSAALLFRIGLNKNKTALFRMNIYYNIIILWHGFILYRMIINKNFGTILFYRVWIPYLVAFYLELF